MIESGGEKISHSTFLLPKEANVLLEWTSSSWGRTGAEKSFGFQVPCSCGWQHQRSVAPKVPGTQRFLLAAGSPHHPWRHFPTHAEAPASIAGFLFSAIHIIKIKDQDWGLEGVCSSASVPLINWAVTPYNLVSFLPSHPQPSGIAWNTDDQKDVCETATCWVWWQPCSWARGKDEEKEGRDMREAKMEKRDGNKMKL